MEPWLREGVCEANYFQRQVARVGPGDQGNQGGLLTRKKLEHGVQPLPSMFHLYHHGGESQMKEDTVEEVPGTQ